MNGAAIAYAFARDGSTGIQSSDEVYMLASLLTKERKPGEERSYNPGVSYRTDSGWVSAAVTNPIPLANGILIEVRKDFDASLVNGLTSVQPTTNDYPWSQGIQRSKPIRVSVTGDAHNFDFQGPFEKEAKRIAPDRF
jgi:hypothetical protein